MPTAYTRESKMLRLSRLILFLIFSLLIACESLTTHLNNDHEAAIMLPNLVNEECRVKHIAEEPLIADDTIDRQYQIYCGRWEHASGSIFKVNTSNSNQNLEQWGTTGLWPDWLSKHAYCDKSSKQNILVSHSALIFNCKLRNGGWPYLALITYVDGSIYLADGIPAVESVLEDGIGILSGVKPRLPTAEAAQHKRVAKFSREKEIYSADDIHNYYQMMRAGQFYNSIKDFKTAAERYRQALALQDRALTDQNSRIDPMMHLALDISNQGRFDEAELLFERVGNLLNNASDPNQAARYWSYKALHAANKRNFEEALQLAHRATQMRRELSKKARGSNVQFPGQNAAQATTASILGGDQAHNPYDMVQSLYIEAAMLERLGRLDDAEQHLREAKALWQRAYEIPLYWEPELIGLTARMANDKGSEDEQSQLLSNAVSLWENIAPGERPSVINYLKLGAAYKQQGHLEQAMATFRKAIELIKQRSGSLNFDQLLPFFEAALEFADVHPDQKAQIHAEMFEAGQLIRSERTTETIAKAVARFSTAEGAAGEVMRDFQEAQDQRHFLYQEYEIALAEPETPEQIAKINTLKDKLAATKQRIIDLGIQVQAALPRYNQLIDTGVNAAGIIKLIAQDEALVQILLGNDRGLLFLVKEQKIQAFLIDLSWRKSAEIVSQLRRGLEPTATGSLPAFDVELAYSLYRKLFDPIADQLNVKHLISVPSGPLMSLPFGLLVTENPPPIHGFDYRQVQWLTKRTAISLLPSVQSFVGLRDIAKASQAPKAFSGFADFVPFSEATVENADFSLTEECRNNPEKLAAYRKQLLSLGSLPITKTEVNEISKTFSADSINLVLGHSFTDHTVKNTPLSDYRILYFATHGLLPAELACQPEPSLVTSLPEPASGKDDGLLDIEEVMGLKLDTDLVVLSACNTGGPGFESGGESLSGLARAFFFAGARALIVSHWLVEDQSTASLMVRTFREMQQNSGTGWASALRSAQLKLIDDANDPDLLIRSHPFLWAAFTVVGDGAKTVAKI